MKWHQLGPGLVQLRLPVFIQGHEAFLCEAFVKDSAKTDARGQARFKVHAQLISQGRHTERGRLA